MCMWTICPQKLICLLLSSFDISSQRETDRHDMLHPIWQHQFCAQPSLASAAWQVQNPLEGQVHQTRCACITEIALALCKTKQVPISFWEKDVVCSTCPLSSCFWHIMQVYGTEHVNRWIWCSTCSWSSKWRGTTWLPVPTQVKRLFVLINTSQCLGCVNFGFVRHRPAAVQKLFWPQPSKVAIFREVLQCHRPEEVLERGNFSGQRAWGLSQRVVRGKQSYYETAVLMLREAENRVIENSVYDMHDVL